VDYQQVVSGVCGGSECVSVADGRVTTYTSVLRRRCCREAFVRHVQLSAAAAVFAAPSGEFCARRRGSTKQTDGRKEGSVESWLTSEVAVGGRGTGGRAGVLLLTARSASGLAAAGGR